MDALLKSFAEFAPHMTVTLLGVIARFLWNINKSTMSLQNWAKSHNELDDTRFAGVNQRLDDVIKRIS